LYTVEVIIAMIRKFVAHLKQEITRAVRAIKAGIGSALYHRVTSVIPVYGAFHGVVATIETAGSAVQTWLQKKIRSHAPVFSLFTFFGDRPTP
jgi:hypothetical protein